MPKYTVKSKVTPIVLEDEEMLDFQIEVLRDGKEIKTIDQRYGVALSDKDMREDITRQIKEIIEADYEEIERAVLKDRAVSIGAIIDTWEIDLP